MVCKAWAETLDCWLCVHPCGVMQVGQIARDSHANGDGDLAALLEGIGTGEDGDPAAAGQKLVQDDTVIVTAGVLRGTGVQFSDWIKQEGQDSPLLLGHGSCMLAQ